MITQAELKSQLHYTPGTGVFTRLCSNNGKVKVGDIAGSPNSQGYLQARLFGKLYKMHRLAFLYADGYFPEGSVDHINRDKSDNRRSNLREVSRQCNLRNCRSYTSNTSGVKGVSWNKTAQKWLAQVRVDQKTKFLGNYKDFADAVCARLAAEQSLNWSGCDKTSPAFMWVREHVQCQD